MRRVGQSPLRFKLAPGNLSEVGELPGLIEGLSAKALLADRGYDSNAVVELALAAGMEGRTGETEKIVRVRREVAPIMVSPRRGK